jgi:hypothetical protein
MDAHDHALIQIFGTASGPAPVVTAPSRCIVKACLSYVQESDEAVKVGFGGTDVANSGLLSSRQQENMYIVRVLIKGRRAYLYLIDTERSYTSHTSSSLESGPIQGAEPSVQVANSLRHVKAVGVLVIVESTRTHGVVRSQCQEAWSKELSIIGKEAVAAR